MSYHTFQFDARAIVALGRENIRDPATAVLELVKNSYDAGASVVRVTISGNEILISDDGEGMTSETITGSWLKIGLSAKVESPYTSAGRRKIGEKGVGRLSADRLGSQLRLRSQSRDADPCEISVDWEKFEGVSDVAEVPILLKTKKVGAFSIPQYFEDTSSSEVAFGSLKNSSQCPGTELHITNLRAAWDKDDLDDLHAQLGTLLSPFSAERFQIQTLLNGVPAVVRNTLQNSGESHFSCRIHLSRSGKKPSKISANYTEWFGSENDGQKGDIDIHELFHGEVTEADARNAGNIAISLTYVPKTKEVALSSGFSVSQLGRHLKENSGVRLYRDGIRVYPYGDPKHPDGDWLGLARRKAASPDAISRTAFKVPPNRLVGAVQITRQDNPDLIDVTGREGLLHNSAYKALLKIARACLKRLENLIVRNNTESPTDTDPLTPREAAKHLSKQLGALSEDLSKAEKSLRSLPPKKRKEIKQLEFRLATTQTDVGAFGAHVDKLIDETTLSRGLATIGVASTTFGHETLGHIQAAFTSATLAKDEFSASDGERDVGLEALGRSIGHIKSIEAWGSFALERVRKDKRKYRQVTISTVVKSTIADLRQVTDITNVMLEQRIKSDVKIKGFTMDIESMIINLLTNAYYFCRRGGRDRWVIQVGVESKDEDGKAGALIWVADTGPGVPARERSAIWKPTYTTKADYEGTGLGLAIVSAIVDDYKGHRSVKTDRTLKGARFEIWLPST